MNSDGPLKNWKVKEIVDMRSRTSTFDNKDCVLQSYNASPVSVRFLEV